MLVLTRKVGESVKVDGPCVIHIGKIDGRGFVRLAFDAPLTTKVLRSELEDDDQEATQAIEGGVK